MKKLDYSHVELDGGRKLYAYGPWFSMPAFGDVEAGYGWDGLLEESALDEDVPLTPSERQEIATHMIARWQEWAKRISDPEPLG